MSARPNSSRRPVAANGQAMNAWTHRFAIVLSLLAIISVAFVYFSRDRGDQRSRDVYVSFSVKTTVGSGQFLTGQVSLVIDPTQEDGIRGQEAKIQQLILVAVADAFGAEALPRLSAVEETIYKTVNRGLPKRLRVRDVLIQDMVRGLA